MPFLALRRLPSKAIGEFIGELSMNPRFGWAVGDAGSLIAVGSWDGVPATVAGLAAS
jgi:hypothetical protein